MKIVLHIQAMIYLIAHAQHFWSGFHKGPQGDAEIISSGIFIILLALAYIAPIKK